jgi:methyl-accepting chemotaxis protein
MGRLTGAMDEIAKTGEETFRIIKTINEIAFQANLQAMRADEAAKNTDTLIEDAKKE